MSTPLMRDGISNIRRVTGTRVIVLTGAGEKFFCIGGRKEGMASKRKPDASNLGKQFGR